MLPYITLAMLLQFCVASVLQSVAELRVKYMKLDGMFIINIPNSDLYNN
jgi:hypothetical protein